ncbi:MAG: Benzene 1,2-dioxygenase [Mycobacterium sp.]|nr:Benzene 1,2-dioxygenase [Mycobacterium sp.]
MTKLSAALVSPTTGDLQHRVEQFLYAEAQLLDDHRFTDWIELFTDDAHYWMPTRNTEPTGNEPTRSQLAVKARTSTTTWCACVAGSVARPQAWPGRKNRPRVLAGC